jgi:hypothetical protein
MQKFSYHFYYSLKYNLLKNLYKINLFFGMVKQLLLALVVPWETLSVFYKKNKYIIWKGVEVFFHNNLQ